MQGMLITMKDDLFSITEKRAVEFGENIWFSHLMMQTIDDMVKYEIKYKEAIEANDDKTIRQAKLQLEATLSSLKLAAQFYDIAEGHLGD